MAFTEDVPSSRSQILLAVFVCFMYIVISTALINANNVLMGKDYFPFATMLTTIDMTVNFACSLLLYCVMPGLFPSMQATKGRRSQILRHILPLAGLSAMGVALSNRAYVHCSVAFLQFMKQGNVCIMFALSCCVGSQVCDPMKCLIVCWVTCGSAFAVTGEAHFVMIGFAIQMTSQLCGCGKNILQEWLLNGDVVKLDPFTYNLFVAPCCLVVLAIGDIFTYDLLIPERLLAHWHLLLPNALVAFSLNVTIPIVIKQTSAMGLVFTGVVKDMVIVAASTWLFGEALSLQQVLGFSASAGGIIMWAFIKVQPSQPVVTHLARSLGMPSVGDSKLPATDAEKQPLCQKSV